jgi:hypothetical protein
LFRDLDLPLGDQRPGDRGAKQIVAFVARIGAHHREDEIADEFLAQIVDDRYAVGTPISSPWRAQAPVPHPAPDRR